MTPRVFARKTLSLLRHAGHVGFQHRGAGRAVLRWKPFDPATYLLAWRMHQIDPTLRTIVDGGANVGQFARACLETFPTARVLSIEPVPESARSYRTNLANEPRARLIEVAIGSHEGTIEFYHNETSAISSALRLSSGAHEYHNGQISPMEAHVIHVPVTTLDALLADEALEAPVMLKLDLEGYVLQALRGASATLGRLDYVLTEIEFVPLFEGAPSFEEVNALLEAAGFQFQGPLDVKYDAAGIPVQMDALYRRTRS